MDHGPLGATGRDLFQCLKDFRVRESDLPTHHLAQRVFLREILGDPEAQEVTAPFWKVFSNASGSDGKPLLLDLGFLFIERLLLGGFQKLAREPSEIGIGNFGQSFGH